MTPSSPSLPLLYKALALFTPGGDLVYCLDPSKQGHWHRQLCNALQTLLCLPETPLFLVPCYTATVDRWLHPQTQTLQISAEAYPWVWRYRPLLNTLFGTLSTDWMPISTPVKACDPAVIYSYQHRFPQLWQNHNLVIRLDQINLDPSMVEDQSRLVPPEAPLGLRLDSSATSSTNPDLGAEIGPSIGARVAGSLIPTNASQGYVLRLFVNGHNSSTTAILETLHQLLDEVLDCHYTLKVIDVAKHPDRAELDHISATPTLIKIWPAPVRRLVGNQMAPEQVVQLLAPYPE
ncbi:MAG: circadian clock protein KaiB [Acaryochloridaceae cyanobacterium SU_2_1]|nr:circadian clock protein KaiB [Acaryochloridaceae cyanobacterium SU_2_1]NJM95277.1 circadian clock protein KaiB [Acaryochloridaceae cyanobacterium CSU_5_19]